LTFVQGYSKKKEKRKGKGNKRGRGETHPPVRVPRRPLKETEIHSKANRLQSARRFLSDEGRLWPPTGSFPNLGQILVAVLEGQEKAQKARQLDGRVEHVQKEEGGLGNSSKGSFFENGSWGPLGVLLRNGVTA